MLDKDPAQRPSQNLTYPSLRLYILNQIIGDADRVLFSPSRDNCSEPYITLKQDLARLGYQCEGLRDQPLNKVAWVLFWDMDGVMPSNRLERIKYQLRQIKAGGNTRDIFAEAKRMKMHIKTALLMFEPPNVCPRNWHLHEHTKFDRIFTWDPMLIDNNKYFQIHLPSPRTFSRPPDVLFSAKKLIVDISSNKRTYHLNSLSDFRYDTIKYFAKHHSNEFDLYGYGWNPNLFKWLFMQAKGSKIFLGKVDNYQGPAGKKSEILSKYRFSICFENIKNQKGYISVKIFDAMRCGCVPVYYGAPDIEKYLPTNTFIDRSKFKNHAELYRHLKAVSCKEHQEYVQNGIKFLKSSQARYFFSNYFSENIISALQVKKQTNNRCLA